MKKLFTAAGGFALLLGLTACGNAGTTPDNQPRTPSPRNAAKTHSAAGTVEKLAADQVTIAHGPVATLQWPAMTMAFSAKDAALLEGVRVGDRVAFSFSRSGAGYALTAIAKQ